MLSKEGIDKLEAIMLANGKYFYDQETFGKPITDCKTELCAAGFCRLLKIGESQFNEDVINYSQGREQRDFARNCTNAGAELLGIKDYDPDDTPQIFNYSWNWPDDIHEAYDKAATPQDRIAVYINMLRTRANDDGSIRELETE